MGYRGKAKHVADVEGDGDSCNKAFSLKYGLTQGVFNVVRPHVITLGFRCLFRAESVGEALSIVLERFPKLPKVIFYDVACKLDKNALLRVRPILRKHGVRCILDRPHSITHSCSPVYMPDESLGATAGVATQAAEVFLSIAVGNRISLAYMSPATYMVHKMVQVAFMNVRKLQRMSLINPQAENDHVPLAPFYHIALAQACLREHSCSCQKNATDMGVQAEQTLLAGRSSVDNVASVEQDADPDSDGSAEEGYDDVALVRSDFKSSPVGAGDRATPTQDYVYGAGSASEGAREALPATADTHEGVHIAPMSTSPLTEAELERPENFIEACALDTARQRKRNKARILVTVADLSVLSGVNWLNEEIMNSFVALVNHRNALLMVMASREPELGASPAARAHRAPRTFIFGTFLYSRLSHKMGWYDYHGVRRWGIKGGLSLESVDLILVPVFVHRSNWTLAAVDVRRRHFFFYDSSFGDDYNSIIPNLRRWLADEVAARLGADVSER